MGSAAWRLVSRTSGRTIAARLEVADGFWSRFVGLQFRRALPPHAALVLVPCRSLHTCFVRFPLDIAFLDRGGSVLAIRRNLLPWRTAFAPPGTYAVLEMLAGCMDLKPGESLGLESPDRGRPYPPKLAAFTANSATR